MNKKAKKNKSKSKPKSKKPTKKTGLSKHTVSLLPQVVPLGSRVLIRPFTKEELTKKNSFGIILPDAGSKDKSEQGTVLAVGPGEYQDGDLIPMRVKVGEKVAFSKYGFEDIHVNGEELFLIEEKNILAILK
jgi:chaperonin GroES